MAVNVLDAGFSLVNGKDTCSEAKACIKEHDI